MGGDCPTGPLGVTNCTGLANGNYQNCYSCTSIVCCWDGEPSIQQCSIPCNPLLLYNAAEGYCDYTAPNCTQPPGTPLCAGKHPPSYFGHPSNNNYLHIAFKTGQVPCLTLTVTALSSYLCCLIDFDAAPCVEQRYAK